ncbi:MAG TPA: ankyrin repeat domain-containing protein [Burkholderiaceae bacterium]|nr:ankyrin repeat domain-containing protein [Burkholderiaceae bacterium]
MDGGNWKELFDAACKGDTDLLRYHISRGVDVNYAHPEFLSTPLVACILERKPDSAFMLLDNGADPTLFSEFEGMTPMQAAVSVGLAPVVSRLTEMGVPAISQAGHPQPGLLSRWQSWLLGRGRRMCL